MTALQQEVDTYLDVDAAKSSKESDKARLEGQKAQLVDNCDTIKVQDLWKQAVELFVFVKWTPSRRVTKLLLNQGNNDCCVFCCCCRHSLRIRNGNRRPKKRS